MRAIILTSLGLVGLLATPCMAAQPDPIGIAPVTLTKSPYVFDTAEQHGIKVTVLSRELTRAFSMAFLPDGDLLVSERGGQLRIIHGATGAKPVLDPNPVIGVPQLDAPLRNGGLHDLALHPDFARNHWLYFTYNKVGPVVAGSNPPQRTTAVSLMRGRLENGKLSDVKDLFVGDFGSTSGSRIVFANDGTIYMTTGGPNGDAAQKLDTVYGKILHLKDDGSIPVDNPYVGRKDANPAIYSMGYRDQLGLTLHKASGGIFSTDHGLNGGDEVNLTKPAHNYGWPTYSFSRNYNGSRASELPVVAGVELPQVMWSPSIAPSGLMFYTGDKFPKWKDNLFVGSARRGEVDRTGGLERVVLNDKLEDIRRETLLTDLHQRIRDVRQGPDGFIYVLTDGDDFAVMRIEPN